MHGLSNDIVRLADARPAIRFRASQVFGRIPFRLTGAIVLTISTVLLLLASYLTYWAFSYRVPPSSPVVIDRRISQTEKPYYVNICAALADNPVGFPGHCYVVWSSDINQDFNFAQSAGYVPSHRLDQLPSLWTHVPGLVARNCVRGNLRNVSVLTVIVDRIEYEKTQRMCDGWNTENFQAGVRDCVAFANAIASELELTTPATTYKYPQDYVRELKNLNNEDMRKRSQR